jgi:hypothetical protein
MLIVSFWRWSIRPKLLRKTNIEIQLVQINHTGRCYESFYTIASVTDQNKPNQEQVCIKDFLLGYKAYTLSPLKVSWRWEETYCLHFRVKMQTKQQTWMEYAGNSAFSTITSCLAKYLILKTEEICSSEKSADFHRAIRRYILQDRSFHNHRCENLKSYK